MFKSNFAEAFSRVHWTVPLYIFIPVIAGLLWLSFAYYLLEIPAVAGFFVLGLAAWTFVEYTLHRFFFHYHPKSERGRRIHWTFHGVHHDYPSDPLRLVMVPVVSIPLGALFYFLFRFILGQELAAAFMPGLVVGYLAYDMTHYAVHHFPIKVKVFGFLREWHMRHHFQRPDLGFGVSSPLWDYVFGTTFGKQ